MNYQNHLGIVALSYISPKPKVKLGPTDLIYSAPPSSFDIAIARNPNQFSLTDGFPVSPRWACKSLVPVALILVQPRFVIGLTEFV